MLRGAIGGVAREGLVGNIETATDGVERGRDKAEARPREREEIEAMVIGWVLYAHLLEAGIEE